MGTTTTTAACHTSEGNSDNIPNAKSNEGQNKKSFSSISFVQHLLMGALAGSSVTVFARVFPFWLPASEAAHDTYRFAGFQYTETSTYFDDTIWTYGTDYGIALVLSIVAMSIPDGSNKQLASKARQLLWGYATSVTAGGIAHQFLTTLKQRQGLLFRLVWTVCVGTVTWAAHDMSQAGNGVVALLHNDHKSNVRLQKVAPSSTMCRGYAAVTTLAVCFGGMSFDRPACDIFIAGITQFPSTVYVMFVFLTSELAPKDKNIPVLTTFQRIWGSMAFMMNAPLLPIYPLLAQYTDWSLGSINALLHAWLLTTWCLQGLSLKGIVMRAKGVSEIKNE